MKFKKGFTLAEVLVTLSIIGVVAAVTLPSLMSDSAFQQVGVKLAKFQSVLENSAMAYAARTNDFEQRNNDIQDFVNDSFIFQNTDRYDVLNALPANLEGNNGVDLKDNTRIGVTNRPTAVGVDGYTAEKYGNTLFTVMFDPMINGLPNDMQRNFRFTVTTKGYVFPAAGDGCLITIYNNDWKVRRSMYRNNNGANGVCVTRNN